MNVAFIPARANSQRIPNKNMRELNGKPLLFWTISAAIRSDKIDMVVLSTESILIVKATEDYVQGAFPGTTKFSALQHPICYSAPEVQTDTIYTYALFEINRRIGKIPDTIVLLAPTSPLRTSKHIDEALGVYTNRLEGTVVSVVRDKKFHWQDNGVPELGIWPMSHDPAWRLGGQWIDDNEWLLCENGAIYITNGQKFANARNYRIPPYHPYIMGEEHLLELDTELDWLIMEEYIKRQMS